MKKSLITSLSIAVMLTGCSSLPKKDEAAPRAYFVCVDTKAKQLDDGKSSAGDIAVVAIASCIKEENATVAHLGTGTLARDARRIVRKNVYPVAINSVLKNRRKN